MSEKDNAPRVPEEEEKAKKNKLPEIKNPDKDQARQDVEDFLDKHGK